MNSQLTPEQALHRIVEDYDIAPANESFLISLADINNLSRAEALLESRASEILELNKLCDKLKTENGKLKERIAQQETETREWQISHRELQDQMDKMRRETVYLDFVRGTLNSARFALSAMQRSMGMAHETWSMFKGILEEINGQLLFGPDDDLPF